MSEENGPAEVTSPGSIAPSGAATAGDADRPTSRFRRLYGAGPLDLLAHLAVFAIAAYALSIMFRGEFSQPLNLALWLLGGAVLHDAVFLPLYGVAWFGLARLVGAGDGQGLRARLAGRPAPTRGDEPIPPAPSRDGRRPVPVVNYVRAPLVLSAVLFLVFLPRILDRQPANFVNALGHPPPDFLGRWLLVSAGFVVASALLYGVARARAARAGRRDVRAG